MLDTRLKEITFNRKGIEIGGPSPSCQRIYSFSKTIDNVIFSRETVWSKHSTNTYSYFPGKSGKVIIHDAVDLSSVKDNSYDFVLSSHSLEHIANPIKAVYEWIRVIKSGAFLILILPEKSQCFDHKRSISKFCTLVSQYEKNVGEDDLSTLPEILENHDLSMDLPAGTFEQFKTRSLNNFNNRCLHHYVYDVNLLKQLCEYIKCDFVVTETRGFDIWFVMKKK
jgi:SAM-dependent methyltransferase